MKNLFGHCIHRANVDWFEDDFFRLQIQEELHVVGECEHRQIIPASSSH